MNNTPTPRTDERKASFALDTIRQLETELTAVTEQRDGLRSGIDYASDQLTRVTEQRDQYKAALQSADNHNHEIATKLEIVTEQRDRLAEALEQCREDSVELLGERDWWQNEIRLDYQKRYQETRDNVTRADEALQSLNQPKP